jgi:hypothetical protein
MAERTDSLRDRETRRIAVDICVGWFKDNGSYIGIGKLWVLVSKYATGLKLQDQRHLEWAAKNGSDPRRIHQSWPWALPEELYARRRINETQNKEFNAPRPPPLVCLGERRFLGETDSCYIPNRQSVTAEYLPRLLEFIGEGEQMQLQF